MHLISFFLVITHLLTKTLADPNPPVIATSKNKAHLDLPYHCAEWSRHQGLLNLRNVGLQRIDSNFTFSSQVSCLNLEENEIAYVSPDAFNYLTQLAYLNLARNNLSLANFTRLANNSRLVTLILDDNNRALDSSENGIKLNFTNHFSQLSKLYLRNNSINDLVSLAFAPRLEYLYLSSNKFADSEFLFLEDAPKTLLALDLTNSSVSRLNATKVPSLHKLLLGNNSIERLCGKSDCEESAALHLCGATELRTLTLANNKITSIESDAFDDTGKLEELDLSANQIDSIQKDTFEGAPGLIRITFEKNRFSEIPDITDDLESLQDLSFAYNRLKIITNDTLNTFARLKNLNLSHNNIVEIQVNAFFNLSLLESIDLSFNKMKVLPDKWMKDLFQLQNVYLHDNRLGNMGNAKICSIYDECITRQTTRRGYSSLTYVSLYNNRITKMHSYAARDDFRLLPNFTIELFSDDNSARNVLESEQESDTCKCDCDKINEVDSNSFFS